MAAINSKKISRLRHRMRDPRTATGPTDALVVLHVGGADLGKKHGGKHHTALKAPFLNVTSGMPLLTADIVPIQDDTVLKVSIYVAVMAFPLTDHKKSRAHFLDPIPDTLTVTVDNPDDTTSDSVDVPVDLVDDDPCDDTSDV
jgi:hypothetical protein